MTTKPFPTPSELQIDLYKYSITDVFDREKLLLESYTALYESHQRLEAEVEVDNITWDATVEVKNATIDRLTSLVRRAKVFFKQSKQAQIQQWLKDAEGVE